MSDSVIGEVFGRTSTQSFKFKVTGDARKWDYVAAEHSESGLVLGQVTEITKSGGETTADCLIIGYRTERGFLRKPRTPLEPGTGVSGASDELIKNTLGLTGSGLYIGLLEGKSNLKSFIEPKKLLSKHLAILAKSGSGKSYAVGVLLEELVAMGVPVVILDPHGEYGSIRYPNSHAEDKKYFAMYDVTARGFAKNVREYSLNSEINPETSPIKLRVPNDSFSLIESLPFKVSPAQKGLLYNLVNDILARKKQFTFRELIKEIEFSESPAKWKLIGGFQALEKSGLFSFSPTASSELVRPGQLTIINFKGAPVESQEVVAQSVLHTLFEQRKRENIPPFFLVIEEAHNFCPDRGFGETKASRIIRTIASEGRKFGLGLSIISQRPARVDKSVLSQCTSQIALQVTNPGDLSAISNSFEGITSETESEIKNLPVGKALVMGASDYPIFVDIRVRRSQHGGRAKTFGMSEAPRRSTRVKTPQERAEKTVLVFEPRISKNDIKQMEARKVKNVKIILRPCLVLNCSEKSDTFQIAVDMMNFSVYKLGGKLEAVKIPRSVMTLSPIQKKILALVNKTGQTSISEIFVKTGLGFGEVNGVLNTLVRQDLVTVHEKIVSSSMGNLNLSRLRFPEKPRFMNLPDAEIMRPKLNESDIINYVQSAGVKVTAKRSAYMPFYKVETSTGIRIVDAMSYSLAIRV